MKFSSFVETFWYIKEDRSVTGNSRVITRKLWMGVIHMLRNSGRVVRFSVKKRYEYVISDTRGCGGVAFPEKKRYVTLGIVTCPDRQLSDCERHCYVGADYNNNIQSRLSTTRPVITLIGCKAVVGASRFFGR